MSPESDAEKSRMSKRPKPAPETDKTSSPVVTKSPFDSCEYRYVRLENGLKALCVHDAKLDFSSAALDVHVGSLSDPVDSQGLAHFLEHLLFMGTEKYPEENDYNAFLSSHGGWSNAFTSDEHTNYFFEVSAEHLEPALDRFAQFFVAPLFGASGDGTGTRREMQAVHSEHQKNVKNDHWRLHQLERCLSCQEHPFSKFGTGSLETLDKPGIVDTLKAFYREHYSANIMALVVYGREPLDTLEQWVRDKFAAVPNHNVVVPTWPDKPLSATEHLGTVITVRSVKEMRSLMLSFPVEEMHGAYVKKPYNYFSHLIGHEGETGLLAYLKRRNWALDLSAGLDDQYHGFAFFQVTVEMTPEGLAHWQDIVRALFSYLLVMQTPQAWIYDECKHLGRLEFAFKDKSSTANLAYKLAGHLHDYAPEHVLNGADLMEEFDGELLGRLVKQFRPDNFRCILALNDASTEGMQKEHWYGTRYRVDKLDAAFVTSLESVQPVPEMTLPRANDFIPTDLSVLGRVCDKVGMPTRVGERNLFHKLDDSFALPKVACYLLIRTDLVFASARDHCRLALFVELLEDQLSEVVYDADLAGLEVKLALLAEGVELRFSGFADKLPVLVGRVLERLVAVPSMPQAEARFAAVKDKYERDLRSLAQNGSDWHASYLASGCLQAKFIHFEAKLVALADVAFGDLPRLDATPVQVDALIIGNITQDDAIRLYDDCLSRFPMQAAIDPVQSVVIRNTDGYTVCPLEAVPQPNHAIEVYHQTTLASDVRMRATTRLLWQLLHEQFFDTLRTKEQLGYVTYMQVRERSSILGFRFLIQSHRDPLYLEERIGTFMAESTALIDAMSAEELAKNVRALANVLTERKKKLTQEAKHWWEPVKDRRLDFAGHFVDAAYLLEQLDDGNDGNDSLKVTALKQDCVALLKQRPSLVVHVWGEGATIPTYAGDYGRTIIRSPHDFPKANLAPLQY